MDFEVPKNLKKHAYKMQFLESNPDVEIIGNKKIHEYFNYFLGNDPDKWKTNVFGYENLTYKRLYPNIDLVVYSSRNVMKYDFKIDVGGDPGDIIIKYKGTDKVYLTKKGNLVVVTSVNNVVESKPYAYQEIDGQKIIVPCKYVLKKGVFLSYKFPIGYNKNYPLLIDPELIFSTYSGSKADNFGYTATFDKDGFLYSGSSILTSGGLVDGYPVTLGAYQTKFMGGRSDIGISKFDTTGKKLIYSTYLGGDKDELPHSIIVNSKGEIIIYGTVESTNFPTTTTAYDRSFNGGTHIKELTGLWVQYKTGSDIFVTKLGKYGNKLLASTYLGGDGNDGLNYDIAMETGGNFNDTVLRYNYADDIRGEVLLDKDDNIYIAGCTRSKNFPVTQGSFQPNYGGGFEDGVLVKMDPDLSKIIWSSFLGGNKSDAIYSIALDKNEDIVLAGGTRSDNFPITTGVIQEDIGGGRADGFVTKVLNDGTKIKYSTFYGSHVYDQNYFTELDNNGNIYLLGQTEVLDSTFIKNAKYFKFKSGQFVSKLSPELDSIYWSTIFGSGAGGPNISPTAFLVDLCNKIYIAGWGGKTNTSKSVTKNNAKLVDGMEVTPDAFQNTTNGSDFYIMVMEDDASKITYGSFFGGAISNEHVDGGTSRFDRAGKIYQAVCAGCTGKQDFPIYPPDAHSPKNQSPNCNLGVFKFDFKIPQTVADFEVPPVVCLPATIKLKNYSYNALKFEWDFGNLQTSTEKNLTVTYLKPGKYLIRLKAINGGTCNLEDSIVKEIEIRENQIRVIGEVSICKGDSVEIGIPEKDDVSYRWIPVTGLNNPNIPNPIASPLTTTIYNLIEFNGYCYDTVRQKVNVIDLPYSLTSDTVFCSPSYITMEANSFGMAKTYHWSTNRDFTDMINAGFNVPFAKVYVPRRKTYYIKMTNDYCERIDSVTLDLYPNNVDVIPDTSICFGDTLTLYAIGDSTLGKWEIHWEPIDSIITNPDSAIIKVRPQKSMWYYVNITLGACSFKDSVYVKVLSFPGVNFIATADQDTLIKGECTFLHAFPDTIKNYQWSPSILVETPNSQTTKTCPQTTTTYTVTAGKNLCDDNIANVRVVVLDFVCDYPYIFVPNAFTPNKNNKNERVYVRGRYLDELYFTIYDRWGEMVFETRDQKIGWDGTYKGRELDPGVFVYYLEATCVGRHNYFKKGNITLIK